MDYDVRKAQTTLANLELLSDARNLSHAWEILERICVEAGFDYSGLGTIGLASTDLELRVDYGSSSFISNCATYLSEGLELEDPTARAMAQGQSFTDAIHELLNADASDRNGAHCVLQFFRRKNISGHAALRIDLPNAPFFGFLGVGTYGDQSSNKFSHLLKRQYNMLRLCAAVTAGIALRDRHVQGGHVLTPREARVLSLLAQGLSLQEIAEEDGRSASTVRQQIASARKRLGVKNTNAAISLAQAIGEISVPYQR